MAEEPTQNLFNHPVIRQLLEQLRVLEQRVAYAEAKVADMGSPFGRLVMIRRTGALNAAGKASLKQWQEQTVVDGHTIDFVDGRKCDDDESPSALLPPTQAQFVVAFEDAQAVRYVPMFNWFRVELAVDDGGGGGPSTAPDYTYVARLAGIEIGRGLVPEMPGRTIGLYVAAGIGWCYYDLANALQLAICDEKEQVEACS